MTWYRVCFLFSRHHICSFKFCAKWSVFLSSTLCFFSVAGANTGCSSHINPFHLPICTPKLPHRGEIAGVHVFFETTSTERRSNSHRRCNYQLRSTQLIKQSIWSGEAVHVLALSYGVCWCRDQMYRGRHLTCRCYFHSSCHCGLSVTWLAPDLLSD